MSSLSDEFLCTKCQNVKPREAFYRRSAGAKGVTSWCKQCGSDHYQQNKDKYRERERRWRAENKERASANHKRHLTKYKERYREYHREYRERNRDRIREYNREYYERNRERYYVKGRRWKARNPFGARTHYQNYQARKRGNGGSYTAAEFAALCAFYDYKCLACGSVKPLTVDHVIPIVAGGSNDITNIQPLCQACNSSKRDKTIDYRPQPNAIPLQQLRLFE